MPGIQLNRVWRSNDKIFWDDGNSGSYANPGQFVVDYYTRNDNLYFNDRISLHADGKGIYDVSPETIRKEDGTLLVTGIQTLDDVLEYFDELGIGQGSSGGGITEAEVQALINAALSPLQTQLATQSAQITSLQNRVTVLEQQAGYTQLATPNVSFSNLTYNSADLSWPAVPNAQGYEIYNGGDTPIATITGLSYQLIGLTEQTNYNPYVIAVGVLPYLDSEPGIVTFTTPAQGGGGSTPLSFSTILNYNTLLN